MNSCHNQIHNNFGEERLMNIKKEKLKVSDMTCVSCEKRIEKEVSKLNGVINVMASNKEASVTVEYDTDLCNADEIKDLITKAGYTVGGKSESLKLMGILFIGLAIYFLGNYQSGFDMSSKLQTGTTFVVLFVVGLFTSIHCVGMCGGIMLSQSVSADNANASKWKSLKPTLLYNGGRVVSYTILGGIVGAIGSVLAISLQVKASISIFAGIFMIVMGFNMAGFRLFKRFNIRMPWSFCKLKNKSRTPFIVGLLNGLLPCGPLQTMQLYALGTGSFMMGALSMFVFSIGTVPLMLTFGLITGFLSKNFTKSILKFSGILVLVLGFIMANRGLALAGVRQISLGSLMSLVSPQSTSAAVIDGSSKAVVKDGVQTLKMTADNNGYTPNVLFVQKGMPVKWIIDGAQINSCNNQLVIPSLNKQVPLHSGENIIEFTPTSSSDITFSCWMGMLNGVIKVVDNIGSFDTGKADVVAPESSTMSCCIGDAGSSSNNSSTGTSGSSGSSIYGNDISKVKTDRLVKVAKQNGNIQSISVKGIGLEFEPVIIVVKTGVKAEINYDLKDLDAPDGVYQLVDGVTGDELLLFTKDKNTNKLSYEFTKPGAYVVLKDGAVINIIKALDSVTNPDLEKIRTEFIGK